MPRLPDWLSFKDLQRLKCEFIGTFFLCSRQARRHGVVDRAAEPVGATYAGVVYAGGPVSGAHYNPATTVALLVRGNIISAKNATLYMLTQALVGDLRRRHCGRRLRLQQQRLPDATADDIDDWNAFATEMLFRSCSPSDCTFPPETRSLATAILAWRLVWPTPPHSLPRGDSGCVKSGHRVIGRSSTETGTGAGHGRAYIFGPPIGAAVAGLVFKLTTLVDAAEESGQSAQIVSQGTYVTFMVEAVGRSSFVWSTRSRRRASIFRRWPWAAPTRR